MALVKCGECNHDVSTFADKCPNCGAPPAKQMDKGSKISLGVLIVGVILGVGAINHVIHSSEDRHHAQIFGS
jgi:hypothetical protein